ADLAVVGVVVGGRSPGAAAQQGGHEDEVTHARSPAVDCPRHLLPGHRVWGGVVWLKDRKLVWRLPKGHLAALI
ncbi:hypothetical protein EBT25_14740, partial [bacterium]|nr:hypothetical protein [bacterium]